MLPVEDFLKMYQLILVKCFGLPNTSVSQTCRLPNVLLGFHKNVPVFPNVQVWHIAIPNSSGPDPEMSQ